PTPLGWFRRLLHKPKSNLNANSFPSSPSSSSSSSSSSPSSSFFSSTGSSPSMVESTLVDISSSVSPRWSKSYDVCVCHSEVDLELAEELVSFLEGDPQRFRCFLQPRDAVAGGAVVTELCEAVRDSHCWVMLITPAFLRDPWCKFQMHQALVEAPVANGRTIPVVKDVERRDYPRELRSIYYIGMAAKERGFQKVRDTLMHCEEGTPGDV
ncbi:TIRAP protein, partial [Turnix velox]|nr:TIRAP protein [Turnix velox]